MQVTSSFEFRINLVTCTRIQIGMHLLRAQPYTKNRHVYPSRGIVLKTATIRKYREGYYKRFSEPHLSQELHSTTTSARPTPSHTKLRKRAGSSGNPIPDPPRRTETGAEWYCGLTQMYGGSLDDLPYPKHGESLWFWPSPFHSPQSSKHILEISRAIILHFPSENPVRKILKFLVRAAIDRDP
jgi:hypothetical protein